MLLELLLEQLEQLEGVGGGAGESGQDRAVGEPPHLPGGGLHDGLVHRHLSVAGHHHPAVAPDAQHRRPVEHGLLVARGAGASNRKHRAAGSRR